MVRTIVALNDQEKAEEKLWTEVANRACDYYGPTLPLAVASRLEAERQLFAGTGLLEHYKLISELYKQGFICEDTSQQATLTGWLMQACEFNPLPPHTVCPSCKRFTLHQEVKDGWDLQDKKCECGTELWSDGHDIPLYLVQRNYRLLNRRISATIAPNNDEKIKRLVEELYQGRWCLIESRDNETQLLFDIFGTCDRRNYVLIPREMKSELDKSNDLMTGEHPFPIHQSNAAIFFLTILGESETVTEHENEEKLTPDMPEHLLAPETLAYAWGTKRILNITYGDSPHQKERERTGDLFSPPDYHEDISPYLPETPCFSDLVMLRAIFWEAQIWPKLIKPWVQEKAAYPAIIPLSLEDIFIFMGQHFSKHGKDSAEVIDHVFSCIFNMKPEKDTADLLRRCEFPNWFIEYILHIIQTQDISDKTTLLYDVLDVLGRAYARQKAGKAIGMAQLNVHCMR